MKHSEGKLTCEGAPDQGIGCQGTGCVPWVCVDLDSHELVSAHLLPISPNAVAPDQEPPAAGTFVLHGDGLHSQEK